MIKLLAATNAANHVDQAADQATLDTASAMAQGIAYSVLLGVIVLFAILSVFFSFRYRRSQDHSVRGFHQAHMNICMGIMLVAIALTQIIMFKSDWLRSIIGAIFLLIGLFNLFAGIRNRRIYAQQVTKGKP
jgi:uncharacterized membrane protein